MVIPMKSIELKPEAERFVQVCAALGNPTRYRILEILSTNPESIVADIVAELPIAQSTVSQHLAVLVEAGLIYGRDAAGGGRCCLIDPKSLGAFAQQAVGWSHELIVGATCRSEEKPR